MNDGVRRIVRAIGLVLALGGSGLMLYAVVDGAAEARRVAQAPATAAPAPIVAATISPPVTLTPMPPATATATPTRTPRPTATATPSPTATPEPLIPSPTPRPTTLRLTIAPSGTPTATSAAPVSPATATTTAAPVPAGGGGFSVPPGERWRMGVSLPSSATEAQLQALQVGWVMNWHASLSPARPAGVRYARTVRFKGGALYPAAAQLTELAAAAPGALWLISNEPDVRWQDNVDAETYARLYHEAYTAIKTGDPNATVAAGGIAQPTGLRLRYLDLVRAAYEAQFGAAMPMQAWHIHNYMLREERNSWGVDIPPGMPDNTGVLFGIDDSGNVETFKNQIHAFRAWMAARGYQGMTLIVSEFGIPMPQDYGFPPERIADYLRETTHFFLTAGGGAGNPNDGGRLVQQWCWYSFSDPTYAAGNLVDAQSRAWTALARAWLDWVAP